MRLAGIVSVVAHLRRHVYRFDGGSSATNDDDDYNSCSYNVNNTGSSSTVVEEAVVSGTTTVFAALGILLVGISCLVDGEGEEEDDCDEDLCKSAEECRRRQRRRDTGTTTAATAATAENYFRIVSRPVLKACIWGYAAWAAILLISTVLTTALTTLTTTATTTTTTLPRMYYSFDLDDGGCVDFDDDDGSSNKVDGIAVIPVRIAVVAAAYHSALSGLLYYLERRYDEALLVRIADAAAAERTASI